MNLHLTTDDTDYKTKRFAAIVAIEESGTRLPATRARSSMAGRATTTSMPAAGPMWCTGVTTRTSSTACKATGESLPVCHC